MQGFKSFADKTVLSFEHGITGVVGPNGSGKSNISDAIRWVMGEMSAKTLRGSNMQDVIFNGTQTRKPLNFAEVSLVLDNSDRLFPIEFDEVMVTRRVFRSGESVYQINKANCRLKDIQELFMDTGLGRDGYSMIGQGNVSQILSTKAEDRRSFFEGAAGVSKYKHRKEEAERKLVSVNENLVRINDITLELESQLKPLENQSKKAREYLVLYEEYKGLDVSLILRTVTGSTVQLEAVEAQLENVNAEIDTVKSQADDFELKIAELYSENEKKDEEQTETNNALLENEAEISRKENEITLAENNISNNKSLAERIDREIENIRKKNEAQLKQIEELEKLISEQEKESRELLAAFENIQTDNSSIYDELSACKAKIDALKEEIQKKTNEVSAGKAEITGLENLRSSYIERKNAVEAEKEAHIKGTENTKREIEENEEKLKALSEKLAAMQERIERQEERFDGISAELETINKQLSEKQLEFNSKSSKKRMLEAMENDYEGYARSVKAVLKAPELKKRAVYGTLSGLITVDKEYVTAIEVALGGALQNIVVEDEEDAKAAIAYLRDNKLGRATFLPVSSVKGKKLDNVGEVKKCSGFVGIASDIVRFDKKYSGIIDSLLARTVVVETIDDGIKLSRQFGYRFKTVTLSGEVLNAGGSMSGGSVNKTSGFLSRASEIKVLGQEISALSTEIDKLKEEITAKTSDLDNVKMQLASYQPLAREYENDILVLENSTKHLKASVETGGNADKALEDELTALSEQLAKSSDEIALLISSVRTSENAAQEMSHEAEELEAEYARIQERKEAKSQELMSETLRLKSLEKDIETEKQSIIDIKAAISENEETIAQRTQDKHNIEEQNIELEKVICEKKTEIDEIREKSRRIKERLAEIDAEKAETMEKLKGIQNSNKELTDRLIALQQELSRVENKQTKLTMERDNLISRLWDDYELTLETAQEVSVEITDEKETAARVSALRAKIKSLGSINIDSIEEYKNVKERFEFLSGQKDDLEKSKDNLSKVISSMQELMEEHFEKQFAEINKSFERVFHELFGGGRGRLYLSEPDNVLESGIEIEVQLPGKSLQNINLYSGGEKSFIAIALLFAILAVKPTPFCILDEIDAALDDVNVSRFATYLKNYLDDTQFVVITHRRGTMEAANVLYGVTMQEKGVTKMLSLAIDDVDESLIK
ncbi:MAG: chromosome segregation protein SMC [Clostridia bacterium]|nr:chromosome segregation protein SMC [Clostridia bacterium]